MPAPDVAAAKVMPTMPPPTIAISGWEFRRIMQGTLPGLHFACPEARWPHG
jgi:hypothetical protein